MVIWIVKNMNFFEKFFIIYFASKLPKNPILGHLEVK